MKGFKNQRVLMIISMVIFGTIGPFVKMIPLPSEEIALYRAILATLLIGCVLIVTRQKIPFSKIKKQLPLLILSGVAMGFNWILLFQAYNYTSVSVATLSYYFAPSIVTLVCPIIFKEKMTKKAWLCFIMSTLGIVLITNLQSEGAGKSNLIGVAFGLSAALLYSSVILLNKFIKGVSDLHRTFLQFISAVLVLVPFVAFSSGFHITTVLSSRAFIYLLIVGLVHTGITYCMYFSAIKDLSGQETAVLSYIDPLVAVLASVLILKEEITLLQIAGGLLILGFALYNELSLSKKK
jgi:drug/metabolite transporter (DMT)-like permease